jgi:hypothetical protein
MLSTQVYAHEAVTEAAPLAAAPAQAAPANVLTQDDLVALFGAEEAGKPVQLALLSQQEMRETEGAFIPAMLIGAGFNAVSYYLSVPSSQRSWMGWGIAIGSGALGGGIGAVGSKFIGSSFGSLTGGSLAFTGSHIANNWGTLAGSRRW